MNVNDKETLLSLLKQHSFQTGKFILASGKEASFYLDCRKTTLLGEGAYLVGKLLYQKLLYSFAKGHLEGNLDALPDAIGGMALGAAPIVTAISTYSAMAGKPIDGFLVRKEAKGHGTARQIEGHIQPWMRIVLVEDVVTTGGSTLRAIEAIRAAYPAVTIQGVLAIVDRQAGGKEAFEKVGVPMESLFTIDQFL